MNRAFKRFFHARIKFLGLSPTLWLNVALLALIGSFSFRIVDIPTPEFSLAIRHSGGCRR